MTLYMIAHFVQKTTQAIPQASEEFLSWDGVLAIFTILSSLGLLIDWGLRISHKEAILKKMGRWEIIMATMPIREWQVRVAKFGLAFWVVANNLITFGRSTKTLDERRVFQKSVKAKSIDFSSCLLEFSYMFGQILIFGCCCIYLLVKVFYFLYKYAVYKLLLAGRFQEVWSLVSNNFFDTFPDYWILNLLTFASIIGFFSIYYGVWDSFVLGYIFSTIFSIITISIAIKTASNPLDSYWFKISGNTLKPIHPIFLATVNVPFDTLTLLISIKFLKYMISKGRFIVLIACLDIVISALSTVLLRTTLNVIENGRITLLLNELLNSFQWLIEIILELNDPRVLISRADWPLILLIFTPFAPVTIYLLVFIFLGSIFKPFTKMTSYILGLLWEQKKTPFFQLAFVVSLIITSAKALSSWLWIKQLISDWFQ